MTLRTSHTIIQSFLLAVVFAVNIFVAVAGSGLPPANVIIFGAAAAIIGFLIGFGLKRFN